MCSFDYRRRAEIATPEKLCAYLTLAEYSSKAVEQLKRRHNLALHERTREHCSRCPPSRAQWHLPEPLLERETSLTTYTAVSSTHHLIHIELVRSSASLGMFLVVVQERLNG